MLRFAVVTNIFWLGERGEQIQTNVVQTKVHVTASETVRKCVAFFLTFHESLDGVSVCSSSFH